MIFYCNYGRMLYRFRNKARYWSKTPTFYTPLYLTCTVPCKLCMLCNRQKYSTFVIFDPTELIDNCKISTQPDPTQPNPRVDPTHGQLRGNWSLTTDTTTTLVNALVISRVDYCNAVFARVYMTLTFGSSNVSSTPQQDWLFACGSSTAYRQRYWTSSVGCLSGNGSMISSCVYWSSFRCAT